MRVLSEWAACYSASSKMQPLFFVLSVQDIFRLAQDTDSVIGDDLSESMLSTQLSHSFMSEQPQSHRNGPASSYGAYGSRQQAQSGQGAGYPYSVNPRRTLDFAAYASSALSSSSSAAGKSSDGNYSYA